MLLAQLHFTLYDVRYNQYDICLWIVNFYLCQSRTKPIDWKKSRFFFWRFSSCTVLPLTIYDVKHMRNEIYLYIAFYMVRSNALKTHRSCGFGYLRGGGAIAHSPPVATALDCEVHYLSHILNLTFLEKVPFSWCFSSCSPLLLTFHDFSVLIHKR